MVWGGSSVEDEEWRRNTWDALLRIEKLLLGGVIPFQEPASCVEEMEVEMEIGRRRNEWLEDEVRRLSDLVQMVALERDTLLAKGVRPDVQ